MLTNAWVYTRGVWAHRQRVSATGFCVCVCVFPTGFELDVKSDALPIEPPRHPKVVIFDFPACAVAQTIVSNTHPTCYATAMAQYGSRMHFAGVVKVFVCSLKFSISVQIIEKILINLIFEKLGLFDFCMPHVNDLQRMLDSVKQNMRAFHYCRNVQKTKNKRGVLMFVPVYTSWRSLGTHLGRAVGLQH